MRLNAKPNKSYKSDGIYGIDHTSLTFDADIRARGYPDRSMIPKVLKMNDAKSLKG